MLRSFCTRKCAVSGSWTVDRVCMGRMWYEVEIPGKPGQADVLVIGHVYLIAGMPEAADYA
jgi:hypothetical protein